MTVKKTNDDVVEETDAGLDFDLAFDEASNTPAPVVDSDDDVEDVPEEEETASSEDGDVEDSDDELEDTDADVPDEDTTDAPAPVEEPNPLAAEVAELKRQLQENQKPVEKPVEPVKEEPESPLNEDDTKALTAMKEDWPEMTRGVESMIKSLRSEISSEIKQAVASVFTQLQPALKTVESVATNTFLDQLEKQHSDAEAIYPKVEEWVKSQPGALSAAYKNILDVGSVEEVAEVFTMFKKATGFESQQPSEKNKPRVVPKEKSRKVEQMRTMKRERSGISAEVDENDFDSAFERAAQSQ